MSHKIPRNAPCPCGSGRKFKQCCLGKDIEWSTMEDGRIAREVRLPQEAIESLERIREWQRAHFGREPETICEGAPPLELLEHWTVEAMQKAGVEPALIYAYEKTDGLLLSVENENKTPTSDVMAWDRAIDEYDRKTGSKARQRRLTERDFEAILRSGPKSPASSAFVDRLPLPLRFKKEDWSGRVVRDLVEDEEVFDYFQDCLEEVVRSGRGESYLKMFCVMTQPKNSYQSDADYADAMQAGMDRSFSAEELKFGLQSLVLTCRSGNGVPATAAFEMLGFIGDCIGAYAERIECSQELETELMHVRMLALVAFNSAVCGELGIPTDQ